MLKGVALSVASSAIFAGLYFYATLLHPLDGQAIFGWRMLLMLPAITVFLILSKDWGNVTDLCKRIRSVPAIFPLLCLSSALLGTQQWLFMWAPINGHGLDVSLGYFLLPLVMLLVGRLAYGERLSSPQKLAALCAAAGVANEIYRVGGIAWPTLLVALGFPLYFLLRRRLASAHTGGLWFDILLTYPIATYFAFAHGAGMQAVAEAPRLYLLLPLLAIISAAGFICYTVASRLLPFGLFGLLGYVEPVLMVGVALILGEQIQRDEWMTFIPIWAAVGLLMCEGALHLSSASRRNPVES
ncbi:EamA family transporter RarD [Pseudomonas sp. JDS28PS106]|uniref:EamA family transporter RarD n=1 Tax=Pseudomonas sp. JDS28PS106 TaxID=2497235 RepID=UPI002FCF9916